MKFRSRQNPCGVGLGDVLVKERGRTHATYIARAYVLLYQVHVFSRELVCLPAIIRVILPAAKFGCLADNYMRFRASFDSGVFSLESTEKNVFLEPPR